MSYLNLTLTYFNLLYRFDDDFQMPQANGPLSQACIKATCKFLFKIHNLFSKQFVLFGSYFQYQ